MSQKGDGRLHLQQVPPLRALGAWIYARALKVASYTLIVLFVGTSVLVIFAPGVLVLALQAVLGATAVPVTLRALRKGIKCSLERNEKVLAEAKSHGLLMVPGLILVSLPATIATLIHLGWNYQDEALVIIIALDSLAVGEFVRHWRTYHSVARTNNRYLACTRKVPSRLLTVNLASIQRFDSKLSRTLAFLGIIEEPWVAVRLRATNVEVIVRGVSLSSFNELTRSP